MVTSMLEKAIEIEGLLRIIRDGNPLPETYILLNMKAAELAEQTEGLEERLAEKEPEKPTSGAESGVTAPEALHADFVMESPATPSGAIPEVIFTVEQPEEAEESLARTIETLSDLGEDDNSMTPEDLSLIEEDDIILSFEESINPPLPPSRMEPQGADAEQVPQENEPEPQLELEDSPKDENPDIASNGESDSAEESIAEASEEDIMPEQDFAPDSEQDSEQRGDEETESEPFESTPSAEHEEEKMTPIEPATPKRKVKLRASFSLNDRFLYARELFNGNMKMFDSTLDFLEGIEDFSIIEDYFYNELEWEPENSNVAAFMNILSKNF